MAKTNYGDWRCSSACADPLVARARSHFMNKCRFALVVDDDPSNIARMQVALAPLDLVVLTAANGQEALAVLREKAEPDGFAGIVITDLKMPVMDGLELLR